MDTNNITSRQILERTLASIAPLPSQMEYAKELATIISMHLHKNQLMDQGFSADALPSPSAIVVAATGQGKTFLIRKMTECLGINLITIDCSSLAAEGWKGSSISQRLVAAMEEAKSEKAFYQSILFFDEVDKLHFWGTKYDQGNAMSNILQLYNSGSVSVEVDKKVINIDSRRFTIILGGAFTGLENIIRERVYPKARIGFSQQSDRPPTRGFELLQKATIQDLANYGLMPELLGRIGTILSIPPLDVEDYRQLLTAPIGSLQHRYANYLSLYGVALSFTEAGTQAVAQMCIQSHIGARAVNPFVDSLMRKAIVAVEEDKSIVHVIVDANGGSCYTRYEHSSEDRLQTSASAKQSVASPWYTVKAKNTPALVQKLCRYYRNANGTPEILQQLEPFLSCSITYLHKCCEKKDMTLDALFALSKQTKRGHNLSPFDEIIQRSLCIPGSMYRVYLEAYTDSIHQNLQSALETIQSYIHSNHGKRQVCFSVPAER